MTMHIITLNTNKQYKHVLCNRNGLTSIKFGSVASFLTLSILEQKFPKWLGGCGKSRGMGGGGVIAYLKKQKI